MKLRSTNLDCWDESSIGSVHKRVNMLVNWWTWSVCVWGGLVQTVPGLDSDWVRASARFDPNGTQQTEWGPSTSCLQLLDSIRRQKAVRQTRLLTSLFDSVAAVHFTISYNKNRSRLSTMSWTSFRIYFYEFIECQPNKRRYAMCIYAVCVCLCVTRFAWL